MVEGVYAAILVVVVGMMLGIIEVPSPGARAGAAPKTPRGSRSFSGPSQNTQQVTERTKLRRLFPSRLV